MSEHQTGTDQEPIERGAAEDASGVPVTPTDVEASRRPPSRTEGEGAQNEGSGGDSGDPDAA
jgi:hypothetical protein